MLLRGVLLARATAVVVLAATAAIAAAPAALVAAVIHVPDQERTIASAMFRAAPGDTIAVEPGRYYGPIILKSNVRLVGVRGPAQTTLHLDAPEPVLRSLGGGPATALIGFTISGSGTGVQIGMGALQVWDCRFEGALAAGLLCSAGSSARLFASEFKGLPVGVDVLPGADLLMMRNVLAENAVGLRIGGENTRVYRNEFLRNDVAIDVTEQGAADVGGALREANGFLGSRRLSLRNRSPKSIAATLNYWGSVDCDSVTARVEGPVIFLPMATESREDSLSACP
jgi:hypothetical protein